MEQERIALEVTVDQAELIRELLGNWYEMSSNAEYEDKREEADDLASLLADKGFKLT